MIWLFIFFILYFIFDVNYFLRLFLVFPYYFVKSKFIKKGLFEDSVQYGICLTTDLDHMWHMNNARYLRECDFGRFQFLLERNITPVMKELNARIVNAGNNIRYRKSLELFDVYKVKTKLLFWDARAFYFEQQLVRNHDNFVCAVNICKMCMLGCTPQKLFERAYGSVTSPEPSMELQKLLESWQLSSERLRKSL